MPSIFQGNLERNDRKYFPIQFLKLVNGYHSGRWDSRTYIKPSIETEDFVTKWSA